MSGELDEESKQVKAKLYRHDTRACWEAPYSSSTGYGTWAQTTTGPLGVQCSSVSSAAWYQRALALSDGSTSTVTEAISTGYMGLTHMLRETSSSAVFGGELDGRTLSALLNKGKPVKGEVYVISTAQSTETLLTTTEASVLRALNSSSAVDVTAVGGLTGSSASSLKSVLSSFSDGWLQSESASAAESNGLVARRCPSNTTAAYIALGTWNTIFPLKATLEGTATVPNKPHVSLQRFGSNSSLQLLLVTVLPVGSYQTGVESMAALTTVCIFLSCVLSFVLASMPLLRLRKRTLCCKSKHPRCV